MASTLPPPSGSLVEYLEEMRLAINRAINLVGDENILVTETTSGKELSFVGELGEGEGGPFFAKITGWEAYGASGKRWRYSWEEVRIGSEVLQSHEPDPDQDVEMKDGRTGTYKGSENTYLINLAEINNTSGSTDDQGNGMKLVAPLGGGGATPGTVTHDKIVPIWTSGRGDGSVLFWTNVENSDHIHVSTSQVVGAAGADDESSPHTVAADGTSYSMSGLNSGDSQEGTSLAWFVDQRLNYRHGESTPALRSFYRRLNILPNGKVLGIGGESALIVDTPEDCE